MTPARVAVAVAGWGLVTVAALAAQLLAWFGVAGRLGVVASATVYGIVLAAALPSPDGNGGWAGPR